MVRADEVADELVRLDEFEKPSFWMWPDVRNRR
jgi:hypothetical protein